MRRRPLHDHPTRIDQWSRSMIDGTLEGTVKLAKPAGTAARPATSGGGGQSIAVGRPTYGELVALSGTVTVPAGGSGLAALLGGGTIDEQSGFASVIDPGDSIVLPLLASYLVEIDVRWTDGYRGGGTVTVTKDTVTHATFPGPAVPWARWTDDVVIVGTPGETLDVHVDPDDGLEHVAEVNVRVAVVEPLRAIPDLIVPYIYAFDDGPRPSSATVDGDSRIAAGDLLVAHLVTAEPTVTAPAGWTLVSTGNSGDFRHSLYTRVAQAGDDTASWTWEATGGTAPVLVLHVLVAIMRGYSTVHQHDLQRKTTAGPHTTAEVSVTTTERARLLLFGYSAGDPADHAVTGAGEVADLDQAYDSGGGGTDVVSLHDAGPHDAGTHPYTLTVDPGTVTVAAALVALT